MKSVIDILPESISALSKSVMWTVCMWVASFVVLWLMCQCGEPWIAFCACACLVMVGVLPLKEDSKNIAHYVFAILSCVLSQVWVGMMGEWQMLGWLWIGYICLLPILKNKWCFVAEVWCVISVLYTIIYFYV